MTSPIRWHFSQELGTRLGIGMGTYSTLIWQSAILGAIWVVLGLIIPFAPEVRIIAAEVASIAFFIVVSICRSSEIKRLANEIDEVLHSGRKVSFSDCKEGDVAILKNEMSKMVARLVRTSEQLESERNALADSLADISHQIRTPLTAISLMLPVIEQISDEGERKHALRDLEAMIEKMSWLVSALLKMAKLDAGAFKMDAKEVLAQEVVAMASAPLEMAMEIRGVDLSVDVDSETRFTGDLPWTAEAVQNIMKNCMEHTPDGGQVKVSASQDALSATIVIEDNGSGISEKDLPHIFERFYRGRQEAPSSSEPSNVPSGFGIGLSLAQSLISAQGGAIRASSKEGTGEDGSGEKRTGARFEIAFPKMVV